MLNLNKNVHIFPESGGRANNYLLTTNTSNVLIEASVPINEVEQQFDVSKLTHIIATHGHYDHISLADVWREKTSLDLHIHPEDQKFLTNASYNLSSFFTKETTYKKAEIELTESDLIPLDEQLAFQTIHTPGHTPGSVCLLLIDTSPEQKNRPIALFAGDTLFAQGGFGRFDFPGGDYEVLKQSIQKLKKLSQDWPSSLPLYCGHGPSTIWEDVLSNNPLI